MVLTVIKVVIAGAEALSKITRSEFGDSLDEDTQDILKLIEGISAKSTQQVRLAEILADAQGRKYTDEEKAEVSSIADGLDAELTELIARKRAESTQGASE